MIIVQLVNVFSTFYFTWKFITVSTIAWQWIPFWMELLLSDALKYYHSQRDHIARNPHCYCCTNTKWNSSLTQKSPQEAPQHDHPYYSNTQWLTNVLKCAATHYDQSTFTPTQTLYLTRGILFSSRRTVIFCLNITTHYLSLHIRTLMHKNVWLQTTSKWIQPVLQQVNSDHSEDISSFKRNFSPTS